jgi:TolB protein
MRTAKFGANLLYITLFFIALAGSVSAQPEPSLSKYLVAFNVLQDQAADDYEVYTIRPDGTGLQNATNNKDVAWTYHSVPGKLLFISDRGACKRCYFLYESDINGEKVRKVTNLQLEDSWMGSRNNGKELVVAGRVDTRTRYQLFIVNLENGHYRQLTNEPNAAFRDPIFSPDGKMIAYVYKKNRADRTEIEELYIMRANGSARCRLTTYPRDDPSAKSPGYKVGPPHWNSRYDFITYQSNRAGKQSIYAVTPDGKKQWKLTDNAGDEGWHDWSSDGDWLVFDSRDDATGRYDVMLMNYNNKQLRKLTVSSSLKYHQAPLFVRVQ